MLSLFYTAYMFKRSSFFTFLFCSFLAQSQSLSKESTSPKQDSISSRAMLKQLGNGYFPTKYFNVDLRYLIKFNQYEGIRTGLGGITNDRFSEKFRINGYTVYGFKDHRYKYSIGGGLRLNKATNTWLNVSYTDDLQETGSTKFLTDSRVFQFFEPRLLNISLFHKHITKSISIQHQISEKLLTETAFSSSRINPTYDYSFVRHNEVIRNFDVSTAIVSLQWNPFASITSDAQPAKTRKNTFPRFTFQYTKSFKNVLKSDFNFSKIDFRTVHKIDYATNNFSEITLVSGITNGNTPLTHLYHAYPNNINKETIMQRFSVAGLTSFETMYFNEFFSDKFTTVQLKHYLKPFSVSDRFKPQLVLISRYAIGDIRYPERHQNITFSSLKKGYTESGFELNKLLFGFGISFTFRYGAYHLPNFDDNIAFKFTFNVSL